MAKQVVQKLQGPQSGRLQQRSKLQGQENQEVEKELQRKPILQLKVDRGGMAAAPELESSIARSRGGGQPLSGGIREPIEKAFGGVDFSGVKVHTDGQSDRLNRSIQAKAFTTGQDVFFQQGAYQPRSRGGQEIIAHELTHVVQQNGGKVQRSPSPQQYPATEISSASEGETAIQRLTAKVPPPRHDDSPIRSTVHKITETVTNQAGDESNTGNFKHENNSEYLDRKRVEYYGKLVGHITTVGSDKNTLVKMHLVNSYLNPKANNWPKNWVWGSATLNHRHNDIEEQAKSEHPKNTTNNVALNYETEANPGSHPVAGMSEDNLVKSIFEALKKIANKMVNLSIPDEEIFSQGLKIDGEVVDDFVKKWSPAVRSTATTKVNVNYRVATKKGAGAWETVQQASKDDNPGDYSIAFHEVANIRDIIQSTWQDTTGGRSTRKRKIPSSKVSP